MSFPVEPVGPLSPYVNPNILTSAPTGISWSTIPSGRGTGQPAKNVELFNICQRASAQADGYCNQVLRATVDVERQQGPDYYLTVQQATGNARIILSRWPVLNINSVRVSANNVFPRQWTNLTTGFWDIDRPVMGVFNSAAPTAAGEGGQSIIIAPGFVHWGLGRKGFTAEVNYTNGWPHCSLTATAAIGATTISVDDCTGWAVATATGVVGATGNIYDVGGEQEVIQVTASSVTSGPGTLTLASGLAFSHPAGIIVTTLPATVQWAVILFATAIALTRGATATTIQTVPGGGSPSPVLRGPDAIVAEAELLLHPYRRII